MSYGFMDIAITPSVRRAQAEMEADHFWSDFKGHREFDRFTAQETAFISQRDSFYMASVSETGWPYVQHRGGPAGFLKVLDDRILAFVDYRGNRQYITTGNLAENDRTCLFLIDYPTRTRLKIYARAEKLALDADPALTEAISDGAYGAKAERIFRLKLEAFDWNCPQHIVPRFTQAEFLAASRHLLDKVAQLEQENASLRERLDLRRAD
jgi:predicted pyridoxine 5'-phosphate oxidase superfamily flavin-nucleotide-binding protein